MNEPTVPDIDQRIKRIRNLAIFDTDGTDFDNVADIKIQAPSFPYRQQHMRQGDYKDWLRHPAFEFSCLTVSLIYFHQINELSTYEYFQCTY